MSKNLEEKVIEERLKHEKSERDLFEQLQQLIAERDLLLQQLVVLDGEDVTVQITREQFEEYNKLKVENEELKREKTKYQNRYQQLVGSYNRAMSYKQYLDEIEEKAKELKNECFYDDFECKDCDMSWRCTYLIKRQILQLIKQAKEGAQSNTDGNQHQ